MAHKKFKFDALRQARPKARGSAASVLGKLVRSSAFGALVVLICVPGAPAGQAGAGSGGIYTCVDGKGRKLTSDRPIPECTAREQRLLNQDGSVKGVVPPTLTAEERAERDAAEAQAAASRAAQADAVRRDKNLRARFPNEAAHRKARESALDTARQAMKASEERLQALARERKPLLNEAEFYKGRPLPTKLKQQLEANDASVEAQRSLKATQEAELVRINQLFDAELDRLRRLWAGAPPGTLEAGKPVAEMVGHDETRKASPR